MKQPDLKSIARRLANDCAHVEVVAILRELVKPYEEEIETMHRALVPFADLGESAPSVSPDTYEIGFEPLAAAARAIGRKPEHR